MSTTKTKPAHMETNGAPSGQPESEPVKIDMQVVQRRVATPGADKPLDAQQVVINIGLLMMQSSSHRYLFLADLEWLLYPPVQLHQFKLYMKEGRPVAYVSWARLSDEAEARFVTARRLSPADWNSGNRLWMVDLVSPYGSGQNVINDLRDRILPGQTFKYWKVGPNGPQMQVVESQAAE